MKLPVFTKEMLAFCAVFAVTLHLIGTEASTEYCPKIRTAKFSLGSRSNVILTGHVYRQFSGKPPEYCGTMCMKLNEICLSFNYCSDNKLCTLNSGNSVKYPQDMTTVEGCSYYDKKAECETVVTGDVGYKFNPLVVNFERISFSVKAPRDAILCLSPQPATATGMYEVDIGGGGNKKAFIGKYTSPVAVSECALKTVHNLLNPDEFRGFWLSFDVATGRLAVGREGDKAAFIECVDPNPVMSVLYIGFKNWAGATVTFRYSCEI